MAVADTRGYPILRIDVSRPGILSRRTHQARERSTPIPSPISAYNSPDSRDLGTPPVPSKRIECMTPPPRMPSCRPLDRANSKLERRRSALGSTSLANPRPRRLSINTSGGQQRYLQDVPISLVGRSPSFSEADPRFKPSYKPVQTAQSVRWSTPDTPSPVRWNADRQRPHSPKQTNQLMQPKQTNQLMQPEVRKRIWSLPSSCNQWNVLEPRWEAAQKRVAKIKKDYQSPTGTTATASAAAEKPSSKYLAVRRGEPYFDSELQAGKAIHKQKRRVAFAETETIHYFSGMSPANQRDIHRNLTITQVATR